jgi:hypothetical protein
LGWQIGRSRWEESDDCFRTEFVVPGGSPGGVELVLRPGGPSNCAGGGVGEVIITFDGADSEKSSMAVTRSPDTCVCAARFLQGEREALVKTIEMLDRPEDLLLCEELDFSGPDPVYQEALEAAFELAHAPGAAVLWE